MHKLRLRGKSQSRAKEGGLANGQKDKPGLGNVSKSSIKHKVPSSAGSSEASRSSRQQQPVLRLNSQDGNGAGAAAGEDEDSFRTSLILVR
jgi:hypothetical protein